MKHAQMMIIVLSLLEIVGDCPYDAWGGGHTRNTRLEVQCMYMVSSLAPHQVVVKQPGIL
jgi:hypothetical protein